jgi:glycosyltransferase involved in cell wall biosynthesis
VKNKITHLTSAHPRYDTRIFYKECISASRYYDVSLVVADSLGNEVINGISIYDVGKPASRKERILKTTKNVLKQARELDSDLYHIHDPELLLVGLKLKKMGKKVVFDAHEDLPKQVMAKHYLNDISKKIISYIVSKLEIMILKKYDFVVAATPFIRDKFIKNGIKSQDINNFPILDELIDIKPNFKSNTICYIGLLYETRGIKEIIKAVENLDVKLIIAGKFFDSKFEKEVKSLKGWQKVDFRGFASRDEVKSILEESIAGLVTLHPTPSYVEAYPVKMFEYMSAGIAVIASDFPLYKEFVEKNNCGLCVNPLDVKQISQAIINIIQNKSKTQQMGKNAKDVIKQSFNWTNEESKLFKIYEKMTK